MLAHSYTYIFFHLYPQTVFESQNLDLKKVEIRMLKSKKNDINTSLENRVRVNWNMLICERNISSAALYII